MIHVRATLGHTSTDSDRIGVPFVDPIANVRITLRQRDLRMDTQDKASSSNEVTIRSLDSFLNAIKDVAGRAKGTVMRPTDNFEGVQKCCRMP